MISSSCYLNKTNMHAEEKQELPQGEKLSSKSFRPRRNLWESSNVCRRMSIVPAHVDSAGTSIGENAFYRALSAARLDFLSEALP